MTMLLVFLSIGVVYMVTCVVAGSMFAYQASKRLRVETVGSRNRTFLLVRLGVWLVLVAVAVWGILAFTILFAAIVLR